MPRWQFKNVPLRLSHSSVSQILFYHKMHVCMFGSVSLIITQSFQWPGVCVCVFVCVCILYVCFCVCYMQPRVTPAKSWIQRVWGHWKNIACGLPRLGQRSWKKNCKFWIISQNTVDVLPSFLPSSLWPQTVRVMQSCGARVAHFTRLGPGSSLFPFSSPSCSVICISVSTFIDV